MEFTYILCACGAYLLGSFPFGRIIGLWVAGIDITTLGSGNIGATNVARELGLRWGILTLCLDVLKGLVPLLGYLVFISGGRIGALGLGLFALAGHQFSVFQRFRGGKGVATSLGVYLGLSPESQISCGIALAIFVLAVYIWDRVSLGSIVSTWSVPALLYFFGASGFIVIGSILISTMVSWKHKDNIMRLVKGEERKWKKRKGQGNKSKSLSSSSSE